MNNRGSTGDRDPRRRYQSRDFHGDTRIAPRADDDHDDYGSDPFAAQPRGDDYRRDRRLPRRAASSHAGEGPGEQGGGPVEQYRRDASRLARSSLWDDGQTSSPFRGGSQPLRARWDPAPSRRESIGREPRQPARGSALTQFIDHYGWRAYALPLLAVVTVVAVIGLGASGSTSTDGNQLADDAVSVVTVTMADSVITTVTISAADGVAPTLTGSAPEDTADHPLPGPDAAPGAGDEISLAKTAETTPPIPDVDPADVYQGVVMGALPDGADFAVSGSGTFHVIPGRSDPFGSGDESFTFTVEAEDGIASAAVEQQFAESVTAILADPRSWVGTGDYTLQRVDSGSPDFRITLMSQTTIREAGYCGWQVQLEASCYNSAVGRVMINDARWIRGAYAYDGDLASYRVYAVNHEVGHALGMQHEACPTDGDLAPVMMPQSWSTSDDDIALLNTGDRVDSDGKVCRANPFVTD